MSRFTLALLLLLLIMVACFPLSYRTGAQLTEPSERHAPVTNGKDPPLLVGSSRSLDQAVAQDWIKLSPTDLRGFHGMPEFYDPSDSRTIVFGDNLASARSLLMGAAPVITGFTPTVGSPNTSVTINGTDFSPNVAGNTVSFNVTHASLTTATSTSLTATVPAGASSGRIKVTTVDGTSTSSNDFFVPPSGFAVGDIEFTDRMNIGETKTAIVGTPNKIGLMLFDGTAGQRISLQISVNLLNAFGFTGFITIIKPDATNLISTNTSNTAFIDTQTLPTTGTYTILFDPSGTAYGSARFTLYDVPPDPSGTITIGGPSVTTIATTVPGQNTRLTFSGTAGQRISLQISATLSACCADIYIIKPDATTLRSTTVSTTGFIDMQTLPTTGTYTILFDPSGTITGNATFTLYDVPPDPSGSITIGGPSVTTTATTTPGQNARLTFSGTAGQRISLQISATLSACCADIYILKPDATTLRSTTVSTTGFIDMQTLPTTGTYTILFDPSGTIIGNATFTLYNVPPDPSGTIAIGGPSVTLTTTVPGQNGLLTFGGAAGQHISLRISATLSACCADVYIIKPDATTLRSTTVSTTGLIDTQTLPTTGTYAILFDPSSSIIGSATFTLFDPSITITGRVLDDSANGLSAVTVSLSGSLGLTTTTDGSGNYLFTNLTPGGNYTVTPSSGTYSFSPTNQTFNNLNVNRIANFVGTLSIVSITGTVTDDKNAGINNVTLALTKNGVAAGTTQTDALGDYGFGNLAVGANYVVTLAGSFTPSSQTFTNLPVNATANFKAAPSIPSQCATASFAAASNFAASEVPFGVTVSDFNGDGKLDLAVANFNSNNVSIFLGTGTGSFSAATNFAVGSNPVSVAVGDFNSDGKLDLAVANLSSNNISILLGAGNGAFNAATNFLVGSGARHVAVGDFNGDGKLDFATPNQSSNNVSILLGTGTGSFGAATNFGAGTTPISVAVGDFNGDGKLDLVTANQSSNNVSILLGTGTGSFSAATNFAVGTNPVSVAVGDFNGDGKLDLAVANISSNNISILLSTGTGSFSAATNFTVGTNPVSVAVGDYNGDGKLDLAVPNDASNNVSILLGTGTGSFSAATNFAAGTTPRSVAAGDFNGDGKFDLAVADGSFSNVSILLNTGTTCNTQTSLSISGQTKDAHNKGLANVTVTLSGPVSRVTQSDAAGNYSFANLTPGGDYSVTAQSPYFVFAPSGAGFFNLSSSQTFNFVAAQVAVPAISAPPSDSFDGATRDATKWNLGTQTEPPSAFDPRVTTSQVNGQLVIKPQAQAVGMHYNGYVATNSFDMTGGNVKVEMVKAATGGADSIFAIGSDTDNFFRFMVHSAGVGTSLAPTVKDLNGIERPLDTTTNQLVIQVKIAGVLNSISIPYDPVQQRFMRFRHEAATVSVPFGAIRFETSPDTNNSNFTLQQRVILTSPLNPVLTELSAGTSNPTNPSEASFGEIVYGSSGFQFSASTYTVGETEGSALITVNRVGDTTNAASVEYTTIDGTAKEGKKYTAAVGRLDFAPGQQSKTFFVLIIDNAIAEGNQTLSLLLRNPNGGGLVGRGLALLTITDDDTLNGANQVDNSQFFVRQHYLDFLNRAPDASGLQFWTNNINNCTPQPACTELQRINTSAAFFISIEFQNTGYLVERIYKAAYGNGNGTSTLNGAHQLPVPIVRFSEFLPDTQQIGQGVIVGQPGYETILENNKQAFTAEFVQRARFTTANPTTLTPAQFVDKLFTNAGVTPSITDRNAAIAEFGTATNTTDMAARARALRRIAENSILNTQEFNRAFVLMQFFGYLRRNPNDAPDADYTGYDFWLTKLNQFNGNFVAAEMVKAFINSAEYRQRFGL